MNSEPFPSSLVIFSSPLCCNTRCLTMARPRPVPPTFLLFSGSTLKNLSVTLGIRSFGIPTPLSLTEANI